MNSCHSEKLSVKVKVLLGLEGLRSRCGEGLRSKRWIALSSAVGLGIAGHGDASPPPPPPPGTHHRSVTCCCDCMADVKKRIQKNKRNNASDGVT